MFSKLFKKPKPNIYLGSLLVAPRGELEKISGWDFFQSNNLEDEMSEKLKSIFSLTPLSSIQDISETDLALDVVIINLNSGEFSSIDLDLLGLPFLMRPKVRVKSRIYYAKTGITKNTFDVKQTLSWKEYFSRSLSLRSIIRLGPLFSSDDMEELLCLASLKLLHKMKKSI